VARPRGFSIEAAVQAARAVFWEKGYERSTLDDLQEGILITRSSLYAAFGSKQGLFEQALASYAGAVILPLFAPMAEPGATSTDVERFFRQLAGHFRSDSALAHYGCMWVNAIQEFAGRDAPVDVRADEYDARLIGAFANALGGVRPALGGGGRRRRRRVALLRSVTLGIWMSVRLDPLTAALACDAVVAEVRGWGARS
jgi:AcrR family transcriptional regulator